MCVVIRSATWVLVRGACSVSIVLILLESATYAQLPENEFQVATISLLQGEQESSQNIAAVYDLLLGEGLIDHEDSHVDTTLNTITATVDSAGYQALQNFVAQQPQLTFSAVDAKNDPIELVPAVVGPQQPLTPPVPVGCVQPLPSIAPAPGPAGPPTALEVEAYLQAFAQACPALVELRAIGTTEGIPGISQGHTIWALVITSNVQADVSKPRILFNALHHARETLTPEIVIDIAFQLLHGYGSNTDVTRWVNENVIWLVPVVNPDGLDVVHSINMNWRKNSRDNDGDGQFSSYDGVDLNRNYPFHWNALAGTYGEDPWREEYRGPASESELEVQSITNLAQERFLINVSYHSKGEEVFYGMTSTPSNEPENIFIGPQFDRSIARMIGEAYAAQILKYGSSNTHYEALRMASPSSRLDGVDREWHYIMNNTLSFVCEVLPSSEQHTPSPEDYYNFYFDIIPKHRSGWQYLLNRLEGPKLFGVVTDYVSGQPVPATLQVQEFIFHNGEVLSTNSQGWFHILAVPGTYHLKVDAPGYITRDIEIVVDDSPSAPVSIPLQRSNWELVFADDFELNRGWTTHSGAVGGAWQRVDPQGTRRSNNTPYNFSFYAPENDHTPSGRYAFVTGNSAQGNNVEGDDVDYGQVELYSPMFSASQFSQLRIELFYRFVRTGAEPGNFQVSLSNNGGQTFVELYSTPVSNVLETESDRYVEFEQVVNASTAVPFSNQMILRVSTAHTGPNGNASIIEAALDDVLIEGLRLGGGNSGGCGRQRSSNTSRSTRMIHDSVGEFTACQRY